MIDDGEYDNDTMNAHMQIQTHADIPIAPKCYVRSVETT